MINDKWFFDNMRANREAIAKFWKERPKTMKLCPNCQIIFNTPGFPIEGAWTCSELCNTIHNMRHPIIPRDSISRLYLLDLKGTLDNLLSKPTEYRKKEDEV